MSVCVCVCSSKTNPHENGQKEEKHFCVHVNPQNSSKDIAFQRSNFIDYPLR